MAGAGLRNGGLTSQAAEGKALFSYLVVSQGCVSDALRPQGTVAQPTMCFKCFPLFGNTGVQVRQIQASWSPQLLFSLI